MARTASARSRGRPAGADPGTRRRILEGALEVFGARGFDGARTRDIADAAGVNLGLLQYHFGGKQDLWRAAVERAFAELRAGLEQLLREPPAPAGPSLAAGEEREVELVSYGGAAAPR